MVRLKSVSVEVVAEPVVQQPHAAFAAFQGAGGAVGWATEAYHQKPECHEGVPARGARPWRQGKRCSWLR